MFSSFLYKLLYWLFLYCLHPLLITFSVFFLMLMQYFLCLFINYSHTCPHFIVPFLSVRYHSFLSTFCLPSTPFLSLWLNCLYSWSYKGRRNAICSLDGTAVVVVLNKASYLSRACTNCTYDTTSEREFDHNHIKSSLP